MDDMSDDEKITEMMVTLKGQQKVISKKVLQLILEQRNDCNEEFQKIGETEKCLEESLWVCKKARSYLNFAKKNLTTTSLEILATYKKREILMDLIKTLTLLKKMKSTEYHLQQLLAEDNYSAAILILLEFKVSATRNSQYKCVEELAQKLQDTLLLTEIQLDEILNEMTLSFNTKKYSKLQEAYKLLGKNVIVMDQLHMNFISAIHTSALNVVQSYLSHITDEKLLFEQICDAIPVENYIPCLISLCKSFWTILVCYYQVTVWHQNSSVAGGGGETSDSNDNNNMNKLDGVPELKSTVDDEVIREKLLKGQIRIWNDIQSKICIYLSSSKLFHLKFEQFIQVLLIVQRLEKVGKEFCNESSFKLQENMKEKSIEFFKRYHSQCLSEISLFLDNEAWVSINSFTSIQQLQEFRSVKGALQRHSSKKVPPDHHAVNHERQISPKKGKGGNLDAESSIHSQDGSSIYGFNGYFFRFNEKSSPFDGGFDESMLEEDILSGIADEASCYFSEESDENEETSVKSITTAATTVTVGSSEVETISEIIVSNTSLTVLRCIGRYLQMCRLLHSISSEIIESMTELIDFYIYAVHEIFGKDVPFSSNDNLYTNNLNRNLNRISTTVLPKLRAWKCDTSILESDLINAEELFGLSKRIVGVESCIYLVRQFEQVEGYVNHLLSTNGDHEHLFNDYFKEVSGYIKDLRRPIYISATSRVFDLPNILLQMSKVKWEINHVTVQHSAYIDTINRCIQVFAMRLEEIAQTLPLPDESIWDTVAHVLTHVLVEGYSNAKKCSTGGRALMQLDFTHLLSILELISTLKFPVHKSYVEIYVKAFYFPKDLLAEWIQEQSDKNLYSAKHLNGLILCTCSNDKKMRQKLMAIIGGDNAG